MNRPELTSDDRAFILDFRRKVAATDGFRLPWPGDDASKKRDDAAQAREALRLREQGNSIRTVSRLLGCGRPRTLRLIELGRRLQGARP